MRTRAEMLGRFDRTRLQLRRKLNIFKSNIGRHVLMDIGLSDKGARRGEGGYPPGPAATHLRRQANVRPHPRFPYKRASSSAARLRSPG